MIGNSGVIGPKVRPTTTSSGIYHLHDRYNISNRAYNETINRTNAVHGTLSESLLEMPSGSGTTTLQYWDTFGQYGMTNTEVASLQPDFASKIRNYRRVYARLVLHYVSSTSYTGDLQIFRIWAGDGYNTFGSTSLYGATINDSTYTKYNEAYSAGIPFEVFTTNTQDEWTWWQRNSNYNESTFTSVTWEQMAAGGTAVADRGKWNIDSGGTPSGGTGYNITAGSSVLKYIYTEVTGTTGHPSKHFWARSPIIYFGDHPRLYLATARYGSTMGALNVHLEVYGKNP
jgi:hypothetical protein